MYNFAEYCQLSRHHDGWTLMSSHGLKGLLTEQPRTYHNHYAKICIFARGFICEGILCAFEMADTFVNKICRHYDRFHMIASADIMQLLRKQRWRADRSHCVICFICCKERSISFRAQFRLLSTGIRVPQVEVEEVASARG